MPKYRNNGGQHEQDGVVYENGAIIDTTLELDKIFLNKFEKVHPDDLPKDVATKEEEPVAKTVEMVAEENLGPSKDLNLESLYGKDVTTKFEGCSDLGCLVFAKLNPEKKNSKLYTVVGEDGEVWHDEKLTSKKKTQNFIDDVMAEEED